MSLFDPSKAIAQLKAKLASGDSLGDALRAMFHDETFGLMELYHAVSQVQGISQKEAMRIVVHETESWGGRRGPAPRAMNILYLENHAVFAEQVTRQFLRAHRVTVVPSLAAARSAFAAGGFDLVLSDYDLDDGKGEQFVRECRATHPALPIIAVSSHEAGNAALIAAGASAVCNKMEFDRIQQIIAGLEQ